jgi:hypothetical protein
VADQLATSISGTLETLAMPADQGLRFDDYQGLFPIGRASFLPPPVPLTHSSERGDPDGKSASVYQRSLATTLA